MNKKGFVLAETLVVIIFVLIIFTLMYNSMVPLLGRYDEISLYDDLDTTYDVYQYRNLIEKDSNVRDIATNHYKIVTCSDLATNKDKCNQLNEFLDVKEGDTLIYINTNYIDDVIKDENVGDEIRDYLNYVKVDPDKCIILLDHNGYISYVESIEYKITYNLNGGIADPANPTKYYMGTDTFTLTNPTKRGYNFTGWTGSNGDTKQVTVTIEQGSVGDRHYVANWEPIIYPIIYNLGNGKVGNNSCAKEGETCNFSGEKQICYGTKSRFNCLNKTNSVSCTNDVFGDSYPGLSKSCFENSNRVKYTIEDTPFTLTDANREGYTFDGWTGTELTKETKNLNIILGSIGDREYTANWTANKYTVTLNMQNGSGGTSSVTATYDSAMPSATAPTRNGYSFKGYYTGTNGTGTQYYNENMNSTHIWDISNDTTLYAKWEVIVYTISYNANGGSHSGNPTQYTVESPTIVLNGAVRDWHTFEGWTNGGVIPTGSTGNKSFTANFHESRLTINYWCNGGKVDMSKTNDRWLKDLNGNTDVGNTPCASISWPNYSTTLSRDGIRDHNYCRNPEANMPIVKSGCIPNDKWRVNINGSYTGAEVNETQTYATINAFADSLFGRIDVLRYGDATVSLVAEFNCSTNKC